MLYDPERKKSVEAANEELAMDPDAARIVAARFPNGFPADDKDDNV